MKRINTEIIVFDLYNTLIKIEKNKSFFLKLYRKSINGFEVSPHLYFQLLLQNLLESLFDILPKEFKYLLDEKIQDLTTEIESVCLFEETISVLSDLKNNYPLYLISNLAQSYESPYHTLGLDKYFEKAIFSFEVGMTKPDARIFNLVEKHSGKKGNQILLIGDSPKSDIQGAKGMKWQHVWLNRKAANRKPNQIQSLTEIKEIMEVSE